MIRSPKDSRKKSKSTRAVKPQGFPKSSRLLRSAEFRIPEAKRLRLDGFQLFYTPSGSGRIGISISKKVLRRANARNRVRRLLKEAFRLSELRNSSVDLHVVGLARLSEIWEQLALENLCTAFSKLAQSVSATSVVKKDGKVDTLRS